MFPPRPWKILDSLALLDWLAVVYRMAHDQEHGDGAGEQGTYAAHD